MQDCQFCRIVESKENMIYEDKEVIAFLDPSLLGKVTLVPKNHFPIIENVPDYIVAHLFIIANSLSKALFGCLNASGTNIIVNNGVSAGQTIAHFSVNIIPRRDNDGMNFQWQPKQLSDEEMSTIELQIKEEAENIGEFEEEKKKPLEMDKKPEKIEEGENYLVKQLRRIP